MKFLKYFLLMCFYIRHDIFFLFSQAKELFGNFIGKAIDTTTRTIYNKSITKY